MQSTARCSSRGRTAGGAFFLLPSVAFLWLLSWLESTSGFIIQASNYYNIHGLIPARASPRFTTSISFCRNYEVSFQAPSSLLRLSPPPSRLMMAKKTPNSKKGRPASTSGFGGAAAETCPCGSSNKQPYRKCCGKLHTNTAAFQQATPEQVVRARYTAYAKRDIDFIIQSTHPLHPSFESDMQHWRQQIETNCNDNFELTSCEILRQEHIDETTATVTFVATMVERDSRQRTAFQETSLFEKVGGAWLYREGTIEDPPEPRET